MGILCASIYNIIICKDFARAHTLRTHSSCWPEGRRPALFFFSYIFRICLSIIIIITIARRLLLPRTGFSLAVYIILWTRMSAGTPVRSPSIFFFLLLCRLFTTGRACGWKKNEYGYACFVLSRLKRARVDLVAYYHRDITSRYPIAKNT